MRKEIFAFFVTLLAFSSTLSYASQAQASAASSNWAALQLLPANRSIYVSARPHGASCRFTKADADTLTCFTNKPIVFQRADVKVVKLPHRGRSMLVGAAIGAGVGIVVGAASGQSCSAVEKASFFGCGLILSRGELAAAGGASLGPIGVPIGFFTDFTRSTVYRAP